MAESTYKRAKKAKAHIHEAERLGWTDTTADDSSSGGMDGTSSSRLPLT